MNNDNFYIGYQSKAPAGIKKFLKPKLIILGCTLAGLAFLLVSAQRGFSPAVFEFGKLTTLEGILVKDPAPMLLVKKGAFSSSAEEYQAVLLVGFGKFGAEGVVYQMENEARQPLDGKKVKLRGSLIYHDGMVLMELTEGKKALISQEDLPESLPFSTVKLGQNVQLRGEIIDPKCYFGVMKPGEGKPHRSCAIRCISGGIPPALKVSNEAGESNYFLLLDEKGKCLHKEMIDFVADPVRVKGTLGQFGNWFILKTVEFERIIVR